MELKKKQRTQKNKFSFILSLILFILMELFSLGTYNSPESRHASVGILIIALVIIVLIISFMMLKTKTLFEHFCMYSMVVAYATILACNSQTYLYAFMFPITFIVILYMDLLYIKRAIFVALLLNILFAVKNVKLYNTSSEEVFMPLLFSILTCVTAYAVSAVLIRHTTEDIDEIQRAMDTQQRVAGQIIALSEELAKKFDTAKDVANGLTECMESTHHSVNDISTSIHTTTEAIGNQTVMTSEIQANILDAQTNADEMKEVSIQAAKAIEEGTKLIQDLKMQASMTADINRGTRETTTELNERIKGVQQITSAILNISQQTNLLALNASIEAARAGDAGRGFAVVADEICKLSEETKSSAEKITNIVDHLTVDTQKASNDMQQSADSSDKQNELIAITGEKFDVIRNSVDNLNSDVSKITASVSDILASNTHINESITNLSTTSEEVSAASESCISISEESMQSLNSLNSLLAEIYDISAQMKVLVKTE